jgi:colanic acid/amylovoran biosynthesis glycosyltransferase
MNNLIVLHATYSWLPQTETWMYWQIQHLPNDIKTHIICDKTENLDQFSLPNIHSYADVPLLQKKYYGVLRKIGCGQQFIVGHIRKYKAQILHSHFGDMAWGNLIAAKRTNIKHVATFYGYDVSYLPKSNPEWRLRYQELFQDIDLILCEGPHMRRCVIGLGCPENKVIVHHLGIPVHDIPFKPRKWNQNEPLKILIAASFNKKKGIPYALEALAIIAAEQKIEVTIIGDASFSEGSQEEKKRILDMIRDTSLQAKTKLLGYQPHSVLLKEAYEHHLFISPSVTASTGDTEGGAPVTILEMAASGMPIISTRHCDIPEVVLDRITGLLADERDVDGLVAHLRWLISNPDKWLQMLVDGRARIESEFDANIQGARLSDIYRHLIG